MIYEIDYFFLLYVESILVRFCDAQKFKGFSVMRNNKGEKFIILISGGFTNTGGPLL